MCSVLGLLPYCMWPGKPEIHISIIGMIFIAIIIWGFDKPALVIDYTITSGFYMGYYDPPWGKPPGHLLSACMKEI